MASKYYTINSSEAGLDVELIAPGVSIGTIKSIALVPRTTAPEVTLFLQNDTSGAATLTHHLLPRLGIALSTTLLIDDMSLINYDTNKFGLYLHFNSSSQIVDVIINT
tara:strand:- start:2349 stop:2672 length:324 start_codon:yes stop_codon:yes gene_type:complete